MIRLEALALAISKMNGGLDDTESKAFKLCNPGMLRTYRPEKKADSDHYRIFTSVMGGFKALTADLQAKCSGRNDKLKSESMLRELLSFFSLRSEPAIHKVVLFLRRALLDESITASTQLVFFTEGTQPLPEQEKESSLHQETMILGTEKQNA